MTTKTSNPLFDLNIEEVLDNWDVHHGIREIIANALDEQVLSKTKPITIAKDANGDWHIRDYGRGIRIEHFTQNENPEKRAAPDGVIGKFGVGLKDALATFHRHDIRVHIRSRHGSHRLRQSAKAGFKGITTLHVEYLPGVDMEGTDVVLRGVKGADVEAARRLFLQFSNERVLEKTSYGWILEANPEQAKVYIQGVYANDEPGFLFSYNITRLTEGMRKRLNRERLNVGRQTYADRVKAILKAATSDAVCRRLADQVALRGRGDQCEEMQWIEVSQKALTLLASQQRTVYFTEGQLQARPDLLDHAKGDGYQIQVVTEQQLAKLERQIAQGEDSILTMAAYQTQWNESHQYRFVDSRDLSRSERKVFDLAPRLFNLLGLAKSKRPRVRVSETIRITNDRSQGVWDPGLACIVIKRSQLATPEAFAGTLLHEVGHALTGTADATIEFENVLTDYLGRTAVSATR